MLDPVVQVLIFFSTKLGNLGWAIIVFTLIIKLLLYPINKSAIKSALKLKTLQPELEKMQKKFAKDPKQLQQAQLKLYKQSGINPLGGCFPQLIQLAVVLVLYRSLILLLGHQAVADGTVVSHFMGLDLRIPDPFYILPVLAAISQFAVSHLMMGGSGANKESKSNKKSKKPAPASSVSSMAMMQKQMVYIMPVMTGVIAANFPAGISLYWVVSTLLSLFQQWETMSKDQRKESLNSLKFWNKGISTFK